MMQAAPQDAKRTIVADTEFAFTLADFRKIAGLVHGQAGIVLTEGKAHLVYSRLAKRLRAIGLRSFRDYCALVESEAGADERMAMIAAMTTNVTRFFRESHHFDHLAKILPALAEAARKGGRLRFWSAGCSSGEEPYSMALTVLGAMPDAADFDVRILATDIDPNMLARGRAAIYPRNAVAEVPQPLRDRWTVRDGEHVRLSDAACSLIRFNELNLLADWPIKGRFDVIFCRNVMIYFDEDTQNRIWSKFAAALNPGGMLYIGHSERIASESLPFDLVAQTTYRLKGGTA
jgi:chemotaxis protein methyltransferase CheR